MRYCWIYRRGTGGPILLAGLKKLEYRGYDSAGLAVRDEATGKIEVVQGERPPSCAGGKNGRRDAASREAAESGIPAGRPMESRRKPMPIPTATMTILWL